MTQQEKLRQLEDIMELEEGALTPETVLSELDEWDSITLLTFISFMDDEFGKNIKGSQLRELKHVADVLALMEP